MNESEQRGSGGPPGPRELRIQAASIKDITVSEVEEGKLPEAIHEGVELDLALAVTPQAPDIVEPPPESKNDNSETQPIVPRTPPKPTQPDSDIPDKRED